MKVYVTVWFKDFRRRELSSELVEGGFDGFELSLDYPICERIKLKDIPQIKDLLRSGLEASVHLPWREIYLASPIDEVRKTSLSSVLKCFEESRIIEPRYAVLHVVTDQAICSDSIEECITASRKSIESLTGVANELGIPLYIETTRNFCCGGLEQAVNYLELGVRLCLDIPHAIERYSRLRRAPSSLKDVLWDTPPQALKAIECVHLHGYVLSGYHVIESHIEPSRELLEEYIETLRKGVIRPEYTVLESFYSAETKKFVKFDKLRWCVDELKKSCNWNRRSR
ncbi:MAG: TIM barrel protein [Sulfolobales archaeon]